MRQVQLFFCMVLGLLLVTLTSGTSLARELPIQSCVARLAAGQSAVSLAAQPEKFDCNLAHSVKGSGNFAVQLRFAPVQPVVDDPLDYGPPPAVPPETCRVPSATIRCHSKRFPMIPRRCLFLHSPK